MSGAAVVEAWPLWQALGLGVILGACVGLVVLAVVTVLERFDS